MLSNIILLDSIHVNYVPRLQALPPHIQATCLWSCYLHLISIFDIRVSESIRFFSLLDICDLGADNVVLDGRGEKSYVLNIGNLVEVHHFVSNILVNQIINMQYSNHLGNLHLYFVGNDLTLAT